MLVRHERGLERLGVKPRARVVALGLVAMDPVVMLEGPVPATEQVLKKAGLKIGISILLKLMKRSLRFR